jgi:hypothetical protein
MRETDKQLIAEEVGLERTKKEREQDTLSLVVLLGEARHRPDEYNDQE